MEGTTPLTKVSTTIAAKAGETYMIEKATPNVSHAEKARFSSGS